MAGARVGDVHNVSVGDVHNVSVGGVYYATHEYLGVWFGNSQEVAWKEELDKLRGKFTPYQPLIAYSCP